MNLTISMNTVLNFLHSMALSTSNKQWLADHLYEEVKAEQKAAATNCQRMAKNPPRGYAHLARSDETCRRH